MLISLSTPISFKRYQLQYTKPEATRRRPMKSATPPRLAPEGATGRGMEGAGTWTRVSRPPDTNVVGRKWSFRIKHVKHNAEGPVVRYTACLVAKGFMQVHGVDYFDSSPVAKLSSFGTILTYAARHDWEVEEFTDMVACQCFAAYLT